MRPDLVTLRCSGYLLLIAASVCAMHLGAVRSRAKEPVLAGADFIAVKNPKRLPARIPCKRIPLGIPGDYKPCLALLKSGDLLIVAFNKRSKAGTFEEYFISFRSTDGGRTWSAREELKGPFGREPYVTVLSDGTLLMSSHILPRDANNEEPGAPGKNYWYSYLHRSTNEGRTWTTHRIGQEDGFPPNGQGTCTDRRAVELPDGTVLLGVASGMEDGNRTYMWRSTDFGKTWDKSTVCKNEGWRDLDGFFSNSDTFRLRSGKLLHVNRVESHRHPIEGQKPPVGWDAYDRTILWESTDKGTTWRRVRDMGYYGEHYGFFLQLADGRILYNWTVRDVGRPLGIQAIVNDDQGKTWDFQTDRIIVESRTDMKANTKPFGGGYGNTVELRDGTLLTPYTFMGSDTKFHLEMVRWRLPRTNR